VVTRPAWCAEYCGHRAEVVFRNFHQASSIAPALALGGPLACEAAVRLRALLPAVHCLAWLATASQRPSTALPTDTLHCVQRTLCFGQGRPGSGTTAAFQRECDALHETSFARSAADPFFSVRAAPRLCTPRQQFLRVPGRTCVT